MTPVDFRFGLLGRDIGYSRSPAIFQSIFRHTSHSGSFELLDLEPDDLEMKFAAMRTGYDGLAVTIPHKQLVRSLVDRVTERATAVGAVNSIHIRHGRTTGGNTDVDGFLLPLNDVRPRLKDTHAVVIGSGGSARAVVYALLHELELDTCTVVGRNERHLQSLADQLAPHLRGREIRTTTSFPDTVAPAIVVNCTPLGGFHHPDESPVPSSFSLPGDCIYYDLNYNQPNKVVSAMRQKGGRVIDGALMLVGQAVASFTWWTGIEVDATLVARDIFPDAVT